MKPLILIAFLCLQAIAEVDQNELPTLQLYQIGQRGKYCVSLTTDESGCISGTNADGDLINNMDLIKGHKLVFTNLSDAVHDMEFDGNNKGFLPPQKPNGPLASKSMDASDPEKRSITCSFHGAQLGVGFRVLDKAPTTEDGNRAVQGAPGENILKDMSPAKALMPTALADVADFIIRRGVTAEVSNLLKSRPELNGQANGKPVQITQLGNNNSGANFTVPGSADNKPTAQNLLTSKGSQAESILTVGNGSKLDQMTNTLTIEDPKKGTLSLKGEKLVNEKGMISYIFKVPDPKSKTGFKRIMFLAIPPSEPKQVAQLAAVQEAPTQVAALPDYWRGLSSLERAPAQESSARWPWWLLLLLAVAIYGMKKTRENAMAQQWMRWFWLLLFKRKKEEEEKSAAPLHK